MLNQKQNKALNLMIKGNMTDTDIAKECKVTRQTIYDWKTNNKEFQDEYDKLLRKEFQYAGAKAFRKQLSLLNSRNDMVAHCAAKDIMDRAGFSVIEKIDVNADVDMDLNINIDYGDDED